MLSIDEIINRLTESIQSRPTGTFFLNGPPGSGKSYLLKELPQRIKSKGARSQCFGPYPIVWGNIQHLLDSIAHDYHQAGYISQLSPNDISDLTLSELCFYLAQNIDQLSHRSIIILDIGNASLLDVKKIAHLFSDIRLLEGDWKNNRIGIHILLAGSWNPFLLELYCKQTRISFPYTPAYNYFHLQGITEKEIVNVVLQKREDAKPIHGEVLYELVGGHPAASLEILNTIPSGQLSFEEIIKSVYISARSGRVGNTLIESWMQLPLDAKTFLKSLLLKRQASARILPELKTLLISIGLIKETKLGNGLFLSFRSWYIELLIRFHAKNMDILDERLDKIELIELMPEVSVVNREAYNVVNDIENQVRNFVVLQLCLLSTASLHILDLDIKQAEKTINLYKKTSKEQEKQAQNKGLLNDLNPLVSYLTTGELARLIEKIADDISSNEWKEISTLIRDLSGIRNAVMHNRLISDSALDELYKLQEQIYLALNQLKY